MRVRILQRYCALILIYSKNWLSQDKQTTAQQSEVHSPTELCQPGKPVEFKFLLYRRQTELL